MGGNLKKIIVNPGKDLESEMSDVLHLINQMFWTKFYIFKFYKFISFTDLAPAAQLRGNLTEQWLLMFTLKGIPGNQVEREKSLTRGNYAS